jgi:NADH-quinone oxidoreductase subunit G
VPASWGEAFAAIAAQAGKTNGSRIGAIVGDLAAAEEIYALKQLMGALRSPNIDARQDGAAIDPSRGRASYLFNATIAGIERADALLIVGSNPRREAAVLNARIRKRWRAGQFPIALIGEKADLTYPYDYLGAGPESLANFGGKSAEAFDKAERPLLILGAGALARPDGAAVASLAAKLAGEFGFISKDWNGFCVLHSAASRVGALDLGFVPGQDGLDARNMARPGKLDLLFLLGADEIEIANGAFVVYIGTHGDKGAHRADVILPGAAYPEKSGLYVNTEGRVQMANRAGFPPGDAREDWAIIRALSDTLGHKLPFDSLGELRRTLYKEFPHFMRLDSIVPAEPDAIRKLAAAKGDPDKAPLRSSVADFYLTNPIARASVTMAECSALASGAARTAAE